MSYKDINNKTGYRNMQGHSFSYSNLKLLTAAELAAAIIDGITEWTPDAPPTPTDAENLISVKKSKTGEALSLFQNEITSLKEGYVQSEIDSWDRQQKEAELYLADNNATVQLLTLMASARGITKDLLATNIMVKVTAQEVNALRKKTGAGMMDCKKVLVEAGGDQEKAMELLREKGLAAASKRAGKVATEGLVDAYIHLGGRVGVLVEVNCETDFVAKSDIFQELVKNLAMQIAASSPKYISPEDVPEEVDRNC